MKRPGVVPALLFARVLVPALAIAWGTDGGRIVFVLYREPKLAALKILGWTFLAVLWWRDGRRLTPSRIVAALTQPAAFAFGLYLLWASATFAWVTVRTNHAYELGSMLLLFFAWVCLCAHPQAERLRTTVEDALLASAAVLTAVGLAQAVGAFDVLPAIDPQYGVRHASLMGYKNPMALALAGQLFLVAGRVAGAGGRARALWATLLVVETGYLATLLSRTSYLAVAAGCAVLIVLFAVRGGLRGVRLSRLAPAVAVLLVVAGAAGLHPATRSRLASAASLAASPGAYLQTDRGVYLRNTLQMVEHRPWGVGLGDWQTHYPLYRRHDRYRAYDDRFQVRRAHSDHVQTLGETGWLGLALWIGFWVAAVASAVRAALARGAPPRSPWVAAQLVAFAAAMATDYVIEVPYLELQLFAVLFLAARPIAQAVDPARAAEKGLRFLAVPLAVIALLTSVAASLSIVKSHRAADVSHHYLRAIQSSGESRAAHLAAAAEAGGTFARLPGHEKTFYRTWLVLADTWLRLGDFDRAAGAAERSLALHPYNPGTFRWLARLERQRGRAAQAERWLRLYQQVMHEVDSGPPEGLRSLATLGIVP